MRELIDNETGDSLGEATPEQIEASDATAEKGEHGLIAVDSDGAVLRPGTWDYQQATKCGLVRTVWVTEA